MTPEEAEFCAGCAFAVKHMDVQERPCCDRHPINSRAYRGLNPLRRQNMGFFRVYTPSRTYPDVNVAAHQKSHWLVEGCHLALSHTAQDFDVVFSPHSITAGGPAFEQVCKILISLFLRYLTAGSDLIAFYRQFSDAAVSGSVSEIDFEVGLTYLQMAGFTINLLALNELDAVSRINEYGRTLYLSYS